MSSRNEAELIRMLEKAAQLAGEQQRVITALSEQFVAFSVALTPVMLACQDADVLIQFKADLSRLNHEVKAMLDRAEELQ